VKNQIQLQPGLSLSQFIASYGTEEQCREVVEQLRWPVGFICPKCGSLESYVYQRDRVKVYQCRCCRAQTTLTEGTVFHSTKLDLVVWFQAIFFITQNKNNVSALELKRHLGVCYRTAWRVKHKLMQVMYEREKSTVLSSRVEVDDAYLGGEHPGGKAGRGSENKIPFIAAIQTNENGNPVYAVFSPVKAFTLKEVASWAKNSLSPYTTVISDGLACFNAVKEAGCSHQKEVVGNKRKSTSMECFKWVNTILGNLKTAITGTYHAFDFEKYSHRYLGEYQYRFNRRFDIAAMFLRLCSASAKIGKMPEKWLRLAIAED
jgi:ribosomal protein L37AE/L43A